MSVNVNQVANYDLGCSIVDLSGDIQISMDVNGFILQSSANFEDFQAKITGSFFPLHISDLTTREYGEFLKRHVCMATSGKSHDVSAEFPAAHCWTEATHCDEGCQHWYSLSVRPVRGSDGKVEGAIGLLRSVQQLRSLERELRVSSEFDPITGLANRRVFSARVQRHLNSGGSHAVVMLTVDAIQALQFRFGRLASEEMLWGFAEFLKNMALPEFELGYLSNEQFGVLMPNTSQAAAYNWAEEVLDTFSLLAKSHLTGFAKISASAGISPARFNADWSLREAAMALLLSRSGGGNRVSFTWPRHAA